jgi:alpha-L-rhamnosidase
MPWPLRRSKFTEPLCGAKPMLPISKPSIELYDLRCESAVDPLGIDSESPRLSWKLRGSGRNLGQQAWQVQVASNPKILAAGRGDLWDSDRTRGSDPWVDYAGGTLGAGRQVYWRVRVWTTYESDVSHWSATATWTMGIMQPQEWGARWITDERLLPWVRTHIGFSSETSGTSDEPKWVQLDLGSMHVVESIRLHAITHTVLEFLGWPERFKVEAGTNSDWSESVLLADYTDRSVPNPVAVVTEIPAGGLVVRYLRVTATRLRVVREDRGEKGGGDTCDTARFALGQIEVISGGVNVAVGATVTASDSIEDAPWSSSSLVDGLGVPERNPWRNRPFLMRHEFTVRLGLRRALFFGCGVGHYTASVNGKAVGEEVLAPAWTGYEKTCLYDTHDITSLVAPGPNAIGVTLAGGMYNVQQGLGRYMKFVTPFRPVMLIAQIRFEYEDDSTETIGTDETWATAPSPVIFSNVFGGEDYDARLEPTGWDQANFVGSDWMEAAGVAGPGGQLRGAVLAAPPMRAHESLFQISVRTIAPRVQVYDFGQNASLMPLVRVCGAAGSRVKVLPAELLQADGTVDRGSAIGSSGATHYGGPEASWNYTLRGTPGGETWRPAFFYHGARYLQVELFAADDGNLPALTGIEARVVHSASEPVGEFSCSSALFNRIRLLVRWAQRSNLAHVITDCPHRERLSWLEQYHLNGPALRYEFDLARLYTKTLGDMADAQLPSGLVPDVAPEYVKFNEGFRDSPEWGGAIVLAAWQQWIWTGDERPLRRHYSAMKRYVAYLSGRAKNHLLSHGLGDWYDLGPGKPGKSQLTPVPLTATAFYYASVDTLARIAERLGRGDDARKFTLQAVKIAAAFHKAFFDPAQNRYATGSQTSHALPLVLGLVPPDRKAAVLEEIVRDVQERGNGITSGDVGYRYLLRALAAGGRSDVIYLMNHQETKPGYGFQLARGATSLTEAWNADPGSSQNHFMLGQIMEWFYCDLAGIAPDPDEPGFKSVLIRPQPIGYLGWARATHASPRGTIMVAWRREVGAFHLEIVLPPNVTGKVTLPIRNVEELTESGAPVNAVSGVYQVAISATQVSFVLASGRYEFRATTEAAAEVRLAQPT